MNLINNSALSNDFKKTYLMIVMIIVAIIMAVLSSSTSLRNYLANSSNETNDRKILAKIFTSYDNTNFVIFKIRTKTGVDIEFYEKDPVHFFQKLKQKFSFTDDKDAFLMIDGNAVNLALSDVNKNGRLDIIVPTVDQFGLSRLNIFKYDSELKQFTQSVAAE